MWLMEATAAALLITALVVDLSPPPQKEIFRYPIMELIPPPDCIGCKMKLCFLRAAPKSPDTGPNLPYFLTPTY